MESRTRPALACGAALLMVADADSLSLVVSSAGSGGPTPPLSTGCICGDVPEEDCVAVKELALSLPSDYPAVFGMWVNCSHGMTASTISSPCDWATKRSDLKGFIGCKHCDVFEEYFTCEGLQPLPKADNDRDCLESCKHRHYSCCQVSATEGASCAGGTGARVPSLQDVLHRASFTCNASYPEVRRRVSTINMRSSRASGSLPAAIGRMQGLEQLDVSDNTFNGTVPRRIASLSSLSKLRLEKNNFDFISDDFCNLFAHLDDGSCDLSNNPIRNPPSCTAQCRVSTGGFEAGVVICILTCASFCVLLKPHKRWARRSGRPRVSAPLPPGAGSRPGNVSSFQIRDDDSGGLPEDFAVRLPSAGSDFAAGPRVVASGDTMITLSVDGRTSSEWEALDKTAIASASAGLNDLK